MSKVTFNVAAANALLRLGRGVRDRNGDRMSGLGALSGDYAPYTLADDKPLTTEQAAAVCRADAKVCADGNDTGIVYGWRGAEWRVRHGDQWVSCFNHPESDEAYDTFTLVQAPDEAPARVVKAEVPTIQFEDGDGVTWELSPDGLRYRCAGGGFKLPDIPYAPAPLTLVGTPEQPRTLTFPPDPSQPCWKEVEGRTIYKVNDGGDDPTWPFLRWVADEGRWTGTCVVGRFPIKPCPDPSVPVIEPRSGAAVRRWCVETGRVARTSDGRLYRWNGHRFAFEMKIGPELFGRGWETLVAGPGGDEECRPADGKPWGDE